MFKQELEVNVKLQVELQLNTTFDEFTVFANCTAEKGKHTVYVYRKCYSNTKKFIYIVHILPIIYRIMIYLTASPSNLYYLLNHLSTFRASNIYLIAYCNNSPLNFNRCSC